MVQLDAQFPLYGFAKHKVRRQERKEGAPQKRAHRTSTAGVGGGDASGCAALIPQGSGVPEHRAAIALHGPCAIHRRSFQPVRGMTGWTREAQLEEEQRQQEQQEKEEKEKEEEKERPAPATAKALQLLCT